MVSAYKALKALAEAGDELAISKYRALLDRQAVNSAARTARRKEAGLPDESSYRTLKAKAETGDETAIGKLETYLAKQVQYNNERRARLKEAGLPYYNKEAAKENHAKLMADPESAKEFNEGRRIYMRGWRESQKQKLLSAVTLDDQDVIKEFDEKRGNYNKYQREHHKERMQDPAYAEDYRAKRREYIAARRVEDPEYVKYYNEYHRNYMAGKRQKKLGAVVAGGSLAAAEDSDAEAMPGQLGTMQLPNNEYGGRERYPAKRSLTSSESTMPDSIRETPLKYSYMKDMADFLSKARDYGNFAFPSPFGDKSVMDTGEDRLRGLGDFLGQAPEEAMRIAYGNSPLKTRYPGISSRLPELQESRKGPAADLLSAMPVGLAGAGAKAGGVGAINAIRKTAGGAGGHWTPQSMERMSELLKGGALDYLEAPPPYIQQWLDSAVPKYMNKHVGSESDPVRALSMGTPADPMSYEQLMDKSIKKRTFEGLPEDHRPPNARPGEDIWQFQPRSQLEEFLRHAGDYAIGIAPNDLARMDIPSLLRKVHEIDTLESKTSAAKQSKRAEAAQRITAEHPGGPFIQTPEASWYKFDKNMDPEKMKLGLSVDTCIGEHCIAQAGKGRERIGYPKYPPVREITTGERLMDKFPGNDLEDSSDYIDNILGGRATGYSLRDKMGQPVGTAYVPSKESPGIARDDMRHRIMSPRDYGQWQDEQRRLGVPLEQRIQLEGGGHIVPTRGWLGHQQLDSIVNKFPKYKEIIDVLAQQRINTLDQIKGRKNMGIPPEFAPQVKEFLGKADLHSSGRYRTSAIEDLAASGVMAHRKSADVHTLQELMAREFPVGSKNADLQVFLKGQGDLADLLKPGRKELTSTDSRFISNTIGKFQADMGYN